MKSYQEAQERLGGRDSRKLENNTYLKRRADGTLAVMLHATDVVTYHPDGRIVLDSGGWRTVTTKDRLNKYAPLHLWARNGQWLVGYYTGDWKETINQADIYQDGMTINPDGSLSGVLTAAQAKAEQKLRAQVRTYAKNYMAALKAGKVPAPSAGDCWFCALKEEKTGKPLGELADRGGNGHMVAHIKEKYYVPSLAWNAARAFGLGNYYQFNIAAYQGMTQDKPIKSDFADQTVEKSIRRYVYRELGLAY